MHKEIIFLNRAYNDMDIQASLIDSFGQTGDWSIRVIGYPCDGYMGHPSYHECAAYLTKNYNVKFESVLEHTETPFFLKWLHKAERHLFQRKHRDQNIIVAWCIKFLYVLVLQALLKSLNKPLPWLDRVTANWKPDIVIIDEAAVQTGRSYMIDKIIPELVKNGTDFQVIQTGQTTYFDANPNKNASGKILTRTEPSKAKRFFVASELDKQALNVTMPTENPEPHGNIRMDKDWIKKLHNDILIPPVLDKNHYLKRLPDGNPKVVFMLSKLGYGIKLDEMKNTIRAVANMEGVACAIKPHTRGMKFDFMNEKEIASCAIVPETPSTLLIEWADIILITGSSIAFHAMLLDKRVGYLQNCQYIKTAFDEGKACDTFNSVKELQDFLQNWKNHGEPELTKDEIKTRTQWQVENIHAGLKSGLTAKHYRDIILKDLNNK